MTASFSPFRHGSLLAVASLGTLLAARAIEGFRAESVLGYMLLIAFLLGVVLMLVGSFMDRRTPGFRGRGEGMTTTEAYLRLAQKAETWIARARLYLALGGLFGALVWIPSMVFGLTAPYRGDGETMMRLASAAGLLAFIACAIVWSKRFREINGDLQAWRRELAGLQGIEADLLGDKGHGKA